MHPVEQRERRLDPFGQVFVGRKGGASKNVIGAHAGSNRLRKAGGLVGRSLALRRWARHRHFDVALGHASNDVAVAAKLLGIPSATAFDYEFAAQQHHAHRFVRGGSRDQLSERRCALARESPGTTSEKLKTFRASKPVSMPVSRSAHAS